MDILGITIWREARGEGAAGMTGVYWVIRNRSAASPHNGWPADLEQVCLQPFQFSCWNSSDTQRAKYPGVDDPQYKAIPGFYSQPDPTGGATAYYDTSIVPPPWARQSEFKTQIGSLKFYRV